MRWGLSSARWDVGLSLVGFLSRGSLLLLCGNVICVEGPCLPSKWARLPLVLDVFGVGFFNSLCYFSKPIRDGNLSSIPRP